VCVLFRKKVGLTGVNGGTNGGRACWAMSETLCGGKKQGSHISKIMSCTQCNFYNQVKQEEGSSLTDTTQILKKLK